jgi:hypothetical protein
MESLWAIFCSIVRLHAPFGMFSSIDLGCLRSCLDELSICMLVSGLLATLGVLLCERWFLHDFCSVYGGKKMIEVLRIVRGLWKRLSLFFNILYLWTAAFVYPLVISYHNFLTLFAPPI